jgi:hypothetical protein
MNSSEISGPTIAIVKRLFAVSGNKCAFPKCNAPLVDPASGKVIGRICHIKGRKPSSSRYDPQQTNADRHAFNNLVLMCPIHHDIIDADEASYTVERLLTIKDEHEQINRIGRELGDDAARQFIASIEGNVIIDGSIISTQNQLGGQVAHRITNVGPQPRQVSVATANAMVAALRKLPPEQVRITALLGDPESAQLATTLLEILTLAGWGTEPGINQAVFTGLPRGVIIRVSGERPTVQTLGNWLIAAGLKAQGELVAERTGIEIIVGSNL